MNITLHSSPGAFGLLVLAHGAGAGSSSQFIQQLTVALLQNMVDVVTFDFAYMQQIAKTGKKRPPDKQANLQAQYIEVIDALPSGLPVFIGGKSMGGRIASEILQQSPVQGAVCFGYPFHPPGKPEKLRIDHLREVGKPVLVVQGERDTFGNRQQIVDYPLAKSVQVAFLDDGDHSFKPRKASGFQQQEHIRAAAQLAATFIRNHT